MIIDEISDIERYKHLDGRIYKGLLYLKTIDPKIKLGTYYIDKGIKAIVSEYDTIINSDYKYEVHPNTIDIQYPLTGKEMILHSPINELIKEGDYFSEKDTCYYKGRNERAELIIGDGLFSIFFRNEPHLPCLAIDETPQHIKKLTVKISNLE